MNFLTQNRWVVCLQLSVALAAVGFVHADGTSAASVPAPAPVPAAPTIVVDAQQSAYRDSIAQETLRKQSAIIQADLAQLVTELKANGIKSADLNALTNASAHLSTLNQQDMQKVIDALQSANITPDEQQRLKSLISAFQGQKKVALKLRTLGSELASEEAQNSLIVQLENLIVRQSANIQQTSILKASGRSLDKLDAGQKNLHDIVSDEQSNIGDEIDLLFKTLADSGTGAAPNAAALVAKAAVDAMNGSLLKSTAEIATKLTNDGPFPQAVAKQVSVRDYLTGILQTAVAKENAGLALQQAKTQLDQVLADQKKLADDAKQGKVDGATLAKDQANINDHTEAAKALLQPINPDAAAQLDATQKAMAQNADALANDKNPADTTPQEQQITKDLQDTQKLLDQQIADDQKKQDQTPADQVADMQQAQDEIKKAQDEEQTDPQQAAKDAQQAQQDAQNAQATDAAQQLADAAQQLNQQTPNTDAANQDLNQANSDLQQQQNALAQDAKDAQALAQASQQVAQAQQLANAADQNLQSNTGNDLSDPAQKLTDAQAKADQAAKDPSSNLPPDAQQALKDAAKALKDASIQAVQGKRNDADAQDKKGIDALKQAQDSLADAMDKIKQDAQDKMGTTEQQLTQEQNQDFDSDHKPLRPDEKDVSKVLANLSSLGGPGQVVGGLSPKDREAITQFQAEKISPEYAPMVEQYMKNLADSSSAK